MVDMVYKNRELFIRFKNIPDDEISGVYDGDCGKIRDEVGVSCYEFINQDDSYKIILSSLSSGFLRDLCFFMEELECNNIPVYLIEAERVGIGSYGEPVVKNIKIIKQLTRLELVEPKPSYKMDITNAQFKDDIIKIDIVTGYSDIKELHTDYIVTDDKIIIDRIWDDYSEFIDGDFISESIYGDIDRLQHIAGINVMTKSEFTSAVSIILKFMNNNTIEKLKNSIHKNKIS